MCHAHWGGHQVTVLSRDPTRHSARLPQVQLVNTLENVVTPIDAIINLAGKSLLEGRWNKHIKEEIRSSRLQTTRRLYDWIATLAVEQRPRRLISASAIGYYGECGDTPLKESAPPGNDFAAQLCRDWENEALRISALGSQVSLIRIGIVLERDGGALGQMLPAFRFGVGGRFGNGQHWMSWIHREDLINMIIGSSSMVSLGLTISPHHIQSSTLPSFGHSVQSCTVLRCSRYHRSYCGCASAR